MSAGSALLTVTGGLPGSFNADDAPLMAGDTGLPISIAGAGPGGALLKTFIASVNPSTGQAALAIAASTDVTGAPGWAGSPCPR